jgi:hypothetical protein
MKCKGGHNALWSFRGFFISAVLVDYEKEGKGHSMTMFCFGTSLNSQHILYRFKDKP